MVDHVGLSGDASGADPDLEWHPLRALSVSQYAGFVEGYFTGNVLNSSSVNYNGQPLSAPKWSYGGDASYALDVAEFLKSAPAAPVAVDERP